ncbi:hypothetical protein [Streptomyces endophyticus]|uniref:Uncharacterized protein n=1 Tax=Streptomyces endophyticus TaxID=714166 RepID=A0ABU6FD31_9ACTN|nr:hypothetical protein [Streptomyces endophyticus]MEB8340741.1 hypothetical protein [Streptomyces endophyticus]
MSRTTTVDEPTTNADGSTASQRRSALFDIRALIALLFGVYGVVVLLVGIFATSHAEIAKSGGINLNVWCGAGMLLLSGFFAAWIRLRPPSAG